MDKLSREWAECEGNRRGQVWVVNGCEQNHVDTFRELFVTKHKNLTSLLGGLFDDAWDAEYRFEWLRTEHPRESSDTLWSWVAIEADTELGDMVADLARAKGLDDFLSSLPVPASAIRLHALKCCVASCHEDVVVSAAGACPSCGEFTCRDCEEAEGGCADCGHELTGLDLLTRSVSGDKNDVESDNVNGASADTGV